MDAGDRVDFAPTSGRVTGVLALVLGVAALVVSLVWPEEYPTPVATGGLLVGALAWSAMLRPRVWLEGDTLSLRGMVSTVHLPLARVQSIVVQQVLVVTVGDKRYANPAVGRSRFRAMRRPRTSRDLAMTTTPGEGWTPDAGADYADYVEERILEAVRAARREGADRGVRRERAWPELVAVSVTAVLFVASFWF